MNLQKQIVDAAVEAAELISQRAVGDVEDRLLGQLTGVDDRTRELAGTVATLRDLIKALSDGYGGLSQAMQKDLYAVVDELRKEAREEALENVRKGSALAVKVFEGEVKGQVESLQERLIQYVDEKHDHAVRATGDTLLAKFEDAKARMESDLKERQKEREQEAKEKLDAGIERIEKEHEAALGRVKDLETETREKATKLVEDSEQKIKTGLDELIEDQLETLNVVKDTAETALTGIEKRQAGLEQAVEETQELLQKDAADLRTEVFLGTEQTLKELQKQIDETLEGIEAPPGPPGPPGPRGEEGPSGTDGVLTRVETWDPEKGAYARRMCVSHLGGVWQCRRDTEDEPGKSIDWVSITQGVSGAWLENGILFLRMSDQAKVELGDVTGPRGREWEHQGTYDPEHKSDYKWGHVVVLRGSAYVARHDAPGECPGPGWRMVLQAKAGPAGKRGLAGPRGKAGEPGPPGPAGPPGRGWRYRGRYTADQAYVRDEVVNHSQALWIALQDVPSHYPPRADQEFWDLVLRNTAGGGGAGGPGTDELVTVTENDTTPGRLQDKLQSMDASVIFSVVSPGGNESLDLAATGAGGGQANTGQNVGLGLGIYKGMSGTILDFFSILDTARVTAQYSAGGNEIELTVPDGVFDLFGSAQQAYDDGSADLTAHKGSADHDGRYYTEAEVDALLAGRVPTSRILTAGPGLSGGGNLTQDRQFFITDTGVTPGAYTHTNLTVNSRGQITSVANGIDTDQRVRVSGTDVQNGYLTEKNESSDGSIVFSITNPGAAEIWNMRLGTTGVSPGTYSLATVTVDDQGRVTTIAQGSVNHAGLPDLASSGHPGGVIQVGGLVGGVVVVAADGTLENSGSPPGGGSGLHADLTDTDTDGHPAGVIQVGGLVGGVVVAAADGSLENSGQLPGGGGASTFTDLTDTPADYVGQQGKLVKVNATENGLIYGDPSGASVSWGDILGTLSDQTDLQAELDNKKDDFTENTAFNKNFGAVVDTVCQGNDSRLSDARAPTAHASTHATGQADELTPADIGAATAAQGALADSAVQPGDDAASLGSGAATNRQMLTADGVGGAAFSSIVWGDITGTLSNQADLQAELDNKKDDFAENTAFNKDFGTAVDTVCQGDDSRLGLASSAVQPGDDAATLGSGAASNGQVLTANGAGGTSWAAAGAGGDIDGAEVIDWRLRRQDLGTITQNVTVDLDLGHKIIGTMDGLADHEINFVSGRGHAVTDWKARIDVAGTSPVWRFDGALITLADGYDISGSSSSVGFSFEKDDFGVGVSERKYQ